MRQAGFVNGIKLSVRGWGFNVGPDFLEEACGLRLGVTFESVVADVAGFDTVIHCIVIALLGVEKGEITEYRLSKISLALSESHDGSVSQCGRRLIPELGIVKNCWVSLIILGIVGLLNSYSYWEIAFAVPAIAAMQIFKPLRDR